MVILNVEESDTPLRFFAKRVLARYTRKRIEGLINICKYLLRLRVVLRVDIQ